MEILTSVKRLYISFKSLVNDFVYSFGRAALLLLVEVQNHTVPVRERGRIRVNGVILGSDVKAPEYAQPLSQLYRGELPAFKAAAAAVRLALGPATDSDESSETRPAQLSPVHVHGPHFTANARQLSVLASPSPETLYFYFVFCFFIKVNFHNADTYKHGKKRRNYY